MHIVENYARRAGAKIDKPDIIEQFYPTEFDKYITIHNSSGMVAKNYPYFQDVVDFLKPILNQLGYQIIQIGSQEDVGLDGATHLHGKTTLNQTAYILRNSSLHLGNDSFAIHLASSYNIPIVGIYSVSPTNVCGPYWGDPEKQILFEPDFTVKKPSFNPKENPSRTKEFSIESIINAVFKLLNGPISNVQSRHIGDRYTDQIIELIPNRVLNKNFASHLVVNTRADLLEEVNENIVLQNLATRKCALNINKEFKNIEGLYTLRANLAGLFYDVTNELNYDFIEKLIKKGLPPQLVIFNKDETALSDIKFKTLDFKLPPPKQILFNENKVDKVSKLADNRNEVYIKSNRVILSEEKIYLTIQHWKEGKNTTSKELKLDIKDANALAKEQEFLYLYQYA